MEKETHTVLEMHTAKIQTQFVQQQTAEPNFH